MNWFRETANKAMAYASEVVNPKETAIEKQQREAREKSEKLVADENAARDKENRENKEWVEGLGESGGEGTETYHHETAVTQLQADIEKRGAKDLEAAGKITEKIKKTGTQG